MTLEELRKVNFKYKKGGRLIRKAYDGFKSIKPIYTPTSSFITPQDNGTLLKVDIPTTTQTTPNTQADQNTNTQITSTTNTGPSDLMKSIFGESEAQRINGNTPVTPTEPTKRLVPKKAGFLRRTSNERKDYEAERRLAINKRYGSDLDNKSRRFAEQEYDNYYTNNTPYEMSIGRDESGSDYYNRVFGNARQNAINNFASQFNDYSINNGQLNFTGNFNDTTPSYSGKYQDVYNWYQNKGGDINTFNTDAAKMAQSMGLTWNNITNWSDMDDDRIQMIFDYQSNNKGLVSDGKLGRRTANRINGVRNYSGGKGNQSPKSITPTNSWYDSNTNRIYRRLGTKLQVSIGNGQWSDYDGSNGQYVEQDSNGTYRYNTSSENKPKLTSRKVISNGKKAIEWGYYDDNNQWHHDRLEIPKDNAYKLSQIEF